MKNLFATALLLSSQIAWAACDYKNTGLMIGTNVISPVKALDEWVSRGKCKVRFAVSIASEHGFYSVEETAVDLHAKGVDLCRVAIRNGIEKLLVKLGKNIEADADTVCREGNKIKAGDLIFEGDVGTSKVDFYFKYQNMRCRNFKEQYYDNGKIKSYFGVICQPKSNETKWIVMDKW